VQDDGNRYCSGERGVERQLMEKFVIEPVLPQRLPEISGFLLSRRHHGAAGRANGQIEAQDAAAIEQRLRWLLLDNPAARSSEPIGFCARNQDGRVGGLTLCFPAPFVFGDQNLCGLGSGSFFVDAAMKSAGFFLFKRYLASPGYAFYFATTCNHASALLWSQLGGATVSASDVEFVIPLKLDSLVADRVENKLHGAFATELARFGGRCAAPLLNILIRSRARLQIAPCGDWDKLASLSRRHSIPGRATSDRSPAILRWRYGQNSPIGIGGIYLVRDDKGNEGWFALSDVRERAPNRTAACVLLDAVWPAGQIDFRDMLPNIVQAAPPSAEAIYIRCRPDFDFTKSWRWFLRQRLASPRACVIVAKGAPALNADLLDYDDNDYVAWS
jgi:hypothetical protein